jgi:hypothetical protein
MIRLTTALLTLGVGMAIATTAIAQGWWVGCNPAQPTDAFTNWKIEPLPVPVFGVTQRVPVAGSFVVVALTGQQFRLCECLLHAEDCVQQAAAQTDPKLRQDYLIITACWLKLSYELSDQLANFSKSKSTEPGTILPQTRDPAQAP